MLSINTRSFFHLNFIYTTTNIVEMEILNGFKTLFLVTYKKRPLYSHKGSGKTDNFIRQKPEPRPPTIPITRSLDKQYIAQ